ncbi:MAG: glycosyltransferase family 2 protein [Candidatus Kryptoniota bacterium]
MIFLLQLLFWISIAVLVHTYFIYPLSLLIITRKGRLSEQKVLDYDLPKVSVLISAYNEEALIETKLSNLKQINYPAGKIEFLIGVDGAKDRTAELIRASKSAQIRLFEYPENRGKVAVLNDLVVYATGEILIFTDANTIFEADAVLQLCQHFRDPHIGGVCGRLLLKSSKQKLEPSYWMFESKLKEMEGMMGATIGANGGIYAIRKECFVRFETNFPIADDFVLPMRVIGQGYKFVYERNAIAFEEVSNFRREFSRKVRIGAQDFNALRLIKNFLSPRRRFVAYGVWSHKVLRWFTPHLMILIFLLNAALLYSGSKFWCYMIIAQIAFYCIGLIGVAGSLFDISIPIFAQIGYFVSVNAALLIGFLKKVLKIQETKWEVRRD